MASILSNQGERTHAGKPLTKPRYRFLCHCLKVKRLLVFGPIEPSTPGSRRFGRFERHSSSLFAGLASRFGAITVEARVDLEVVALGVVSLHVLDPGLPRP